jgi:hypothetical protein
MHVSCMYPWVCVYVCSCFVRYYMYSCFLKIEWCVYLCVRAHINVCMCVCIGTHTLKYTCMDHHHHHTHLQVPCSVINKVCIVYMYVFMRVCVYVCMYVCIYGYVHTYHRHHTHPQVPCSVINKVCRNGEPQPLFPTPAKQDLNLICTYVCVCVYIYIYIYIYTHTHTRAYMGAAQAEYWKSFCKSRHTYTTNYLFDHMSSSLL